MYWSILFTNTFLIRVPVDGKDSTMHGATISLWSQVKELLPRQTPTNLGPVPPLSINGITHQLYGPFQMRESDRKFIWSQIIFTRAYYIILKKCILWETICVFPQLGGITCSACRPEIFDNICCVSFYSKHVLVLLLQYAAYPI